MSCDVSHLSHLSQKSITISQYLFPKMEKMSHDHVICDISCDLVLQISTLKCDIPVTPLVLLFPCTIPCGFHKDSIDSNHSKHPHSSRICKESSHFARNPQGILVESR